MWPHSHWFQTQLQIYFVYFFLSCFNFMSFFSIPSSSHFSTYSCSTLCQRTWLFSLPLSLSLSLSLSIYIYIYIFKSNRMQLVFVEFGHVYFCYLFLFYFYLVWILCKLFTILLILIISTLAFPHYPFFNCMGCFSR